MELEHGGFTFPLGAKRIAADGAAIVEPEG